MRRSQSADRGTSFFGGTREPVAGDSVRLLRRSRQHSYWPFCLPAAAVRPDASRDHRVICLLRTPVPDLVLRLAVAVRQYFWPGLDGPRHLGPVVGPVLRRHLADRTGRRPVLRQALFIETVCVVLSALRTGKLGLLVRREEGWQTCRGHHSRRLPLSLKIIFARRRKAIDNVG